MGTVSTAAALPAEAGAEGECRPDTKQGQNQKLHKGTSFLRQDQKNVIDQEGHHPGDDALAYRHTGSLQAGAKLPLDCGDSGHAGGVEQCKGQEAAGRDGSEKGPQRSYADLRPGTGEDAQGRDNGLLGDKTGNEGGGYPPVAEAQGRQSGGRRRL